MSAIAEKLLREAYFARDKTVRIPRADHFSAAGRFWGMSCESGICLRIPRRRAGQPEIVVGWQFLIGLANRRLAGNL